MDLDFLKEQAKRNYEFTRKYLRLNGKETDFYEVSEDGKYNPEEAKNLEEARLLEYKQVVCKMLIAGQSLGTYERFLEKFPAFSQSLATKVRVVEGESIHDIGNWNNLRLSPSFISEEVSQAVKQVSKILQENKPVVAETLFASIAYQNQALKFANEITKLANNSDLLFGKAQELGVTIGRDKRDRPTLSSLDAVTYSEYAALFMSSQNKSAPRITYEVEYLKSGLIREINELAQAKTTLKH